MSEADVKRHRQWTKQLNRAVEADGWGQVLEAVEAYEQTSMLILQDLPHADISPEQQDLIEKVVVTINLRATCLGSLDGHGSRPTKDEMEDIAQVLESVLQRTPRVFPLDLAELDPPPATEKTSKAATGDTRDQRLSILIDKIGLKDAERYVDPQIIVSCYCDEGGFIEPKQEVPISTMLDPPYIGFNHTITLETTMPTLHSRNCVIFFEFVHYKKEKRKKSVRCWTMLELDEIQPRQLILELYAKPCDVHRKQIRLLTEKPLYLHLTLTFV
ncbi:axin interactor [Thraustotheca clavata]|uniref:Axin interactor n=1 Tax=Thraustotheca clavata TaxID=74557 RepID=A0A1V9Y409_9STRA|nr:axin interactor [Thraustotheca clavata]